MMLLIYILRSMSYYSSCFNLMTSHQTAKRVQRIYLISRLHGMGGGRNMYVSEETLPRLTITYRTITYIRANIAQSTRSVSSHSTYSSRTTVCGYSAKCTENMRWMKYLCKLGRTLSCDSAGVARRALLTRPYPNVD